MGHVVGCCLFQETLLHVFETQPKSGNSKLCVLKGGTEKPVKHLPKAKRGVGAKDDN